MDITMARSLFSINVILSAHFSIYPTVEHIVTLPSHMRDFYTTY